MWGGLLLSQNSGSKTALKVREQEPAPQELWIGGGVGGRGGLGVGKRVEREGRGCPGCGCDRTNSDYASVQPEKQKAELHLCTMSRNASAVTYG